MIIAHALEYLPRRLSGGETFHYTLPHLAVLFRALSDGLVCFRDMDMRIYGEIMRIIEIPRRELTGGLLLVS